MDQIIKKSDELQHEMNPYKVSEIRIGEGITSLNAGPLFVNVYPREVTLIENQKGYTNITECESSSKEITLSLPDFLEEIGFGTFAGKINPDQLLDETGFTMFTLPVTEMYVSEKNKYYKVKDHVLYSKDGKTVYQILPSYHDSRLVLDKNCPDDCKRGMCQV